MSGCPSFRDARSQTCLMTRDVPRRGAQPSRHARGALGLARAPPRARPSYAYPFNPVSGPFPVSSRAAFARAPLRRSSAGGRHGGERSPRPRQRLPRSRREARCHTRHVRATGGASRAAPERDPRAGKALRRHRIEGLPGSAALPSPAERAPAREDGARAAPERDPRAGEALGRRRIESSRGALPDGRRPSAPLRALKGVGRCRFVGPAVRPRASCHGRGRRVRRWACHEMSERGSATHARLIVLGHFDATGHG